MIKQEVNKTKQNESKLSQLGMLLFDEVKIKEGLVFYAATWELLGFTDIDDDCHLLLTDSGNKTEKPKIATNVMQFFFQSLLNRFTYPCACFLTNSGSAVKSHQIFWQGESMLSSFGFNILLTCSYGASENRKVVRMNVGHNDSKCAGFNVFFSGMPLFSMSDPPHLMKKLRNNLNKSGDRSESKRFTWKLMRNDKTILWKHIVSLYV